MNESLQTLSHVNKLKSELSKNPNFLRDMIKPMLLENQHCAYIKMIPKEDYENDQIEREANLLKNHLDGLTRQQRAEFKRC